MSLIPVSRKGIRNLAAACFLLTTASLLAAEPPGQWIVVTPPEFREALKPLIQERQSEGFKVVVLQTTDVLSHEQLEKKDGTALQAKLRELCANGKSKSYVLLAGVGGDGATNAITPIVPAHPGAVARMSGRPTDSGYGLPGEDGTPAVAVGRFPARDKEELAAMVRKTLAFEKDYQPAPWRNRLLLLIGNPGGGPLAEMFVEQTVASDMATLDPTWTVRTLFNASSSAYYLPRPRNREAALRYLGEGNLFSIYLGHSDAAVLDLDGKFMSRSDWSGLSIPQGAGPLFSCGCFSCQSDPKGDGYGLAAIRNVAGPVAVIGATGESLSAPGQLAIEGLLASIKQPPFPSRLGDYWLGVASGLAHGKMDPGTFSLLDMADGSGGKLSLAEQRREHLEMWLLLGDPALRMPVVPNDISLETIQSASVGKDIEVNGHLPGRLKNATVHATLERPLASRPADGQKIPENSPENRQVREKAFTSRHQSANSFVLTTTDAKVTGDRFTALLTSPTNAPWSNFVVRVSATLSNEMGMGVILVPIK
jgi:hypothetical protein